MHWAVPPRQTKVQLHMRQRIFWKVVWKEKSNILQAATTRSKEAEKFYCIHLVWSRKQVFLPNLLWSYFWNWVRLDSDRVFQLSRQQRLQQSVIFQRSPSEPEFFQVEQVSPVIANNEFNAEPFYTLPSNLQLQHWWTGNYGLFKSQDNWSQHPTARWLAVCKNGIYQYQRLWLLWLHGQDGSRNQLAPSHRFKPYILSV